MKPTSLLKKYIKIPIIQLKEIIDFIGYKSLNFQILIIKKKITLDSDYNSSIIIIVSFDCLFIEKQRYNISKLIILYVIKIKNMFSINLLIQLLSQNHYFELFFKTFKHTLTI